MEKEKSQLKAGVILNYINMILGNIIPIFYTPIMLRLLGQTEYGLYKLSSSITSYLSLITLGMGAAITRYLIKYKVKNDKVGEEKILGLFMLIFRLFSILAFLIGFVIIVNLDYFYGSTLTVVQLNNMKIIIFILVINMSISFLLTPYAAVVNAHEKFIFMQSINIVSTCLLPLANLIVLFMGFKSVGLAVVSLLITVLINMSNLIYVKKIVNINARYKNLPLNLLKEIFYFSFWIFVANIVNQLYNTTDTLMIGTIPRLATNGVAVYNIGLVFVNIVSMFSVGLSGVLAPKTNRLVFEGKDKEEITDFAISIARIQGYIVLLVASGFIVFGRQFIYFYAGKEYLDAYWVAICIIIPNIIPTLQSVFLNVIIALNKHKFRSFVYLLIAIINVLWTWCVLDKFGIIGAAFVTGISFFIGAGIIINIYYWKYIKLNIPKFWKKLLPVLSVPIFMCIVGILTFNYINIYHPVKLLVSIIAYSIIFIILNWKIIMNDYEKDIILNIIRRLFVFSKLIKKEQ